METTESQYEELFFGANTFPTQAAQEIVITNSQSEISSSLNQVAPQQQQSKIQTISARRTTDVTALVSLLIAHVKSQDIYLQELSSLLKTYQQSVHELKNDIFEIEKKIQKKQKKTRKLVKNINETTSVLLGKRNDRLTQERIKRKERKNKLANSNYTM